jgi:signal peptidase I
VAAVSVLVAILWLPVLQIYGSAMIPTLQDEEVVFSVRTTDLQQGDIIAFYIIAKGGKIRPFSLFEQPQFKGLFNWLSSLEPLK